MTMAAISRISDSMEAKDNRCICEIAAVDTPSTKVLKGFNLICSIVASGQQDIMSATVACEVL